MISLSDDNSDYEIENSVDEREDAVDHDKSSITYNRKRHSRFALRRYGVPGNTETFPLYMGMTKIGRDEREVDITARCLAASRSHCNIIVDQDGNVLLMDNDVSIFICIIIVFTFTNIYMLLFLFYSRRTGHM